MNIKFVFEELMNEKCLEFKKVIGGVTNHSYTDLTKNKRYIIRIPGKGTNEYINRNCEIAN